MVHYIRHIVHAAEIRIIIAGDNSGKFPFHFLLNDRNRLWRNAVHISHSLKGRDPFLLWKLFQDLGCLLRIHI